MSYAAYEYRPGCPESRSGLHRGMLKRFLVFFRCRECYLCGHRWLPWPWDR